jgi:hypothetical protein
MGGTYKPLHSDKEQKWRGDTRSLYTEVAPSGPIDASWSGDKLGPLVASRKLAVGHC